MGVRLPSEYQEVEYLETSQTGAPYINSGVAITEDLVFEIDFQLLDVVRARYFMGTYNGTDFYLYVGYKSQAGAEVLYFQTAFGSTWQNTTLLADTQRHKFTYQFENGNLVVKDSATTILTRANAGFSERPILVAGTSQGAITPCRTYESKMTKSGVVIQDLIPCYRKADDTPGMYDLVTGAFFTNAGSGAFLVGPDVINSISPMMVAWRRMLMRKPSPIPTGYVTDGLLLWLDAICNTRNGHDANALYWEDLSGNQRDYAVGESEAVFQASSVSFPSSASGRRPGMVTSNPFTSDDRTTIVANKGTIEVVMSPIIDNQYKLIYGQGNDYGTVSIYQSNLSFNPMDSSYSVAISSGTHGYNSNLWVDGVQQQSEQYRTTWTSQFLNMLFSYNGAFPYYGQISCIRIYSRKLTDAELTQNWLRDNARYNIT